MSILETLARLDTKMGRYSQRWLQITTGYDKEVKVQTTRRINKQRPGPQSYRGYRWVQKERVPTKASLVRLERLLMANESQTAVFINDGLLVEFNPGDYPVEVTQ